MYLVIFVCDDLSLINIYIYIYIYIVQILKLYYILNFNNKYNI